MELRPGNARVRRLSHQLQKQMPCAANAEVLLDATKTAHKCAACRSELHGMWAPMIPGSLDKGMEDWNLFCSRSYSGHLSSCLWRLCTLRGRSPSSASPSASFSPAVMCGGCRQPPQVCRRGTARGTARAGPQLSGRILCSSPSMPGGFGCRSQVGIRVLVLQLLCLAISAFMSIARDRVEVSRTSSGEEL